MIPNGTPVLVSDPKHLDSNHTQEFEGVVTGYDGINYTVEDQDGNAWDVAEDEVTPVEV